MLLAEQLMTFRDVSSEDGGVDLTRCNRLAVKHMAGYLSRSQTSADIRGAQEWVGR